MKYKVTLNNRVYEVEVEAGQAAHGFLPLGAEEAPAQQLPHPVADVGKAQIGNGIDLLPGQIHLKIVFHSFPPRFTRYCAQSPVNSPVKMLMTIITGRYTSSPSVRVMAMAAIICPMEWAMAPRQPAAQS